MIFAITILGLFGIIIVMVAGYWLAGLPEQLQVNRLIREAKPSEPVAGPPKSPEKETRVEGFRNQAKQTMMGLGSPGRKA